MNYKLKQMVAKLLKLAIRVSEETVHDVFVDYAGHVGWLDVKVYIGGHGNGTVLYLVESYNNNHPLKEFMVQDAIDYLYKLLRGESL